MKQFKTVLKFEYLNYIKGKGFIVSTILLLALIIIAASIPNIIGLFNSIFSGGTSTEEPAVVESAYEASAASAGETNGDSAAYYDPEGVYTPEILSLYSPGYNWVKISSLDGIEDLISDGAFATAVSIDGLNVDVYETGSDAMWSSYNEFFEMVAAVYQTNALLDKGLTQAEINDILNVSPAINTISVGRDLSQSYWLSYALLFLLYFAILMYGQYVTVSVVTEKSSKAMELLISSANPLSLMFGKVIGTGLAGLTQFAAIIVTAIGFIRLNLSAWMDFSPMVASIFQLSLSANLFIYTLIFFLLGFFSFAFIYAAFASTVSRMEDANGIQTIPMLLFVAAFLVAIFGLSFPDATYIKVCSFVPFLSPLIMFMRICTTDVPTFQILIAIAANILYILGAGYISARIYKVGVMLYGNKPSIGAIIKMIRA